MSETNTTHRFLVYSAYYDPRNVPIIRVIGATNSEHVWCKFYYTEALMKMISLPKACRGGTLPRRFSFGNCPSILYPLSPIPYPLSSIPQPLNSILYPLSSNL